MPSAPRTSAEIEEQWRQLYVAMTRAKDDLHLVVPQRFFRPTAARADE
jgi:DNA helicase II / ATP-dependent DNA helicase PcrA